MPPGALSNAHYHHASMKRHPALQDLSRDHQLFLLQCRQIRWCEDNDHRARSTDETHRDFLAFWDADGRVHLEEEEVVLLPRLLYRSDALDEHVRAIAEQHAALRREIAGARAEPSDPPRLYALGRLLESHVRFEERVVFAAAQAALDDAALAALWTASIEFREVRRGPDRIGARGGASCVVKKR
jgi:hypothetical protein